MRSFGRRVTKDRMLQAGKRLGVWLARAMALAALSSVALAYASCGETVKLVQTNASGGLVTYPLKSGESHLTSPFRREALERIRQYCTGNYILVKEGETKGWVRIQQGIGGDETIVQRRWGLKFRCQDQ